MDEEELLDELRNDAAPPGATEEAPSPPDAAAERRVPRKEAGIPSWAKILLVFGLLGAGVAVLLAGTGAGDAFVYSKVVSEVMADVGGHVGRPLRVEGKLVQGSIVFEQTAAAADGVQGCEHRFTLEDGGYEMDVVFAQCVVPDTFRDDMPIDVVVEGEIDESGTFIADQIIPRCPSKYEMDQRRQNGEEMPDYGARERASL
jgi:cytochrome c-type biogenesis protein CcmE